jgi:hypothetical protein
MAIFSGEVTIKVRFKDIQVAVGYGMTSAIIKHRCVEQAYAKSPCSKIKNKKMIGLRLFSRRKILNRSFIRNALNVKIG